MPDILIDPKNLLYHPDAVDRRELFRLFNYRLLRDGIVKKGFFEALLKREEEYPTGLDMGEYKIALPHTDTHMVNMPALAAAVLEKPIKFGVMGSPHRKIGVRLVLLMILKESRTRFYRNLLNNIRNSDILHGIYNTDNRQELCLQLTKLLNTF